MAGHPAPRAGRHVRRVALAALVLVVSLLGGPAAASGTAPSRTTPGAASATDRLASAGLVVDAPAGVPLPPAVGARSFVVADATTGEVLAARDARTRRPPASTLKLLTALALVDRLPEASVVTATAEDVAVEGSKAGLVPGGTYTVDQLWQALFLRSGNDAASALARAGGGTARTVRDMNALAQRLGATGTRARTTHGLDEPGQHSTAYDLALIGRAALQSPTILRHAGTVSSVFPGAMPEAGEPRETFELWTQQDFVVEYAGALGLKNGWTTQGRNTLVAAAERDGRRVLVTLLASEGEVWREAAALSDWAFAHAARVEPVGRLVDPAPAPAAEPAAAPVAAAAAVTADDGRLVASPVAVGALLLALLLGLVVVLRRRAVVRRRRRARQRRRQVELRQEREHRLRTALVAQRRDVREPQLSARRQGPRADACPSTSPPRLPLAARRGSSG